MKRKYGLLILPLLVLCLLNTCEKDFLVVTPVGETSDLILANEKGINTLLIGAYSMLDGVSADFGWEAASSNWLWGDVRGLIANVGTDAGNQSDINPIKVYEEKPDNTWLNVRWRSIYEAISRCNNTIRVTKLAFENGTITQQQADLFTGQARALRGWYHFEAWRMWQLIPYIDENSTMDNLSNRTDIRDKIVEDLTEGTLLPDNMKDIGRFNATVSKVLLAKALMQMYHNYNEALPLLLDVKVNGTKPNGAPIGLAATYGEIFDIEQRNGIESVYTVQYSVNDGSGGFNGGYGEVLNFPYKTVGEAPAGCCGFYQPAQEFVNSFNVDENGLPLLDFEYNSAQRADFRDQGVTAAPEWDSTRTYWMNQCCTAYDPSNPNIDLSYISLQNDNVNNQPLSHAEAWKQVWKEDNSKPVDPRLDWTVGRRGIPYWDWGIHTGSDWIRDQFYAGPYSPKKQVYKKSQEGIYTEVGNWTSGWTANGYRMIRYADVLLLLAECQIETGDLSNALLNVNAVRERAANPAGFVTEADGITPAATYKVGLYTGFQDVAFARKALYMERKLELGMEGHRYFDLFRWGISISELTRALAYEKTVPWGMYMYGGAEIGPEDINYPIPQRQIELSNGKLVQNRLIDDEESN